VVKWYEKICVLEMYPWHLGCEDKLWTGRPMYNVINEVQEEVVKPLDQSRY
jgi:hypothetical protein